MARTGNMSGFFGKDKGVIVRTAKFILVDEKECWKPACCRFLPLQRVHDYAALLQGLILTRYVDIKIFGNAEYN
jgi:hypothetical protein